MLYFHNTAEEMRTKLATHAAKSFRLPNPRHIAPSACSLFPQA